MTSPAKNRPARRGHPATVFLGALALLLAYNARTLDDPPYWDALLGLFAQSVWLADNGCDLVGLMGQPSFIEGGPRVIPLYLLAPIYAGLYKVLPPAGVFIAAHLMNLALAALALAVLYALLKERLGAGLSLLWCAALALDPIWSGQCAAIYLEIPQAAVSLLALRAFDKGRFKRAALWCVLGFLIKPSALLLALAFAVYIPARLVFARLFRAGEARLERPSGRVWWLAAPLPLLAALWFWLDLPDGGASPIMAIVRGVMVDAPQQLAILALFLVGSVVALSRRSIRAALLERPRDIEMLLMIGALVLGFWVGFLRHTNPLVRYAVPIMAPALLGLALLTARLAPGKGASAALALSLALFGAINQRGLLLQEIGPQLKRSGQRLERSREFLDDLEGNRRLCRALEAEYRDAPIAAKWPFAQMLTLPKLGYVREPLRAVRCTYPKPSYAPVAAFQASDSQRPGLLYLYAPNVFELVSRPSFDPPPSATILLAEESCGAYVVVYILPRKR